MVRFIHTADVQLGMRATDVPEVAERVREARFDTLGRVMALATEEAVDFVLIAGDLFEDNQVSAQTAYRAAGILADARPIPVYLLPGNHDPLTADSVYYRAAFGDKRPDNVVVLATPEAAVVSEECVLFPCPITQRQSTFDPTAGMQAGLSVGPGVVRIGVAHGSLAIEGRHSPDDHPIAPDAATRAGVDYLAVGHWHSRYIHDPRTAYPGSPEASAFGERDSGTVLLVTVKESGALPHIEARPVGELQWLAWDVDLTSGSLALIEEQRRRAERLADRDKTLLRVVFRGAVAVDLIPALDDFEAWLHAQGLLYADVRREIAATEVLLSKLGRLAEQDSVLAGALADLQALADIGGQRAGPDSPLSAESLGIEELLALWNSARGGEQIDRKTAVAEALVRLAQLAEEVAR
jgi:DNA repair exonuclease SbcCD nuclease subunit